MDYYTQSRADLLFSFEISIKKKEAFGGIRRKDEERFFSNHFHTIEVESNEKGTRKDEHNATRRKFFFLRGRE